MHHGEDSTHSVEGDLPRSVRGSHGEPGPADGDAPDTAVREAGAIQQSVASDDLGQLEERTEFFQVAQSFSGPLPPVGVLRGYDEIVPGSAKDIIDNHIRSERVAADALERLTKAEAFGVTIGAGGAQVLTIGGLTAGVVLILLGYPIGSVAAFIPGVLGASAQVVSAWRSRGE